MVARYPDEPGLRVLAALDAVAARHAATPGQVALAWQMARSATTAPNASATSLAQLAQLAQLAELVTATRLRLTAQDTALLDDTSG